MRTVARAAEQVQAGAAARDNAGAARLAVPGVPVEIALTLRMHRRGPADPTHRVEYGPDDGPVRAVWRTALTPDGPGTLRARVCRDAEAEPAPEPGSGSGTGTGSGSSAYVELTAWGEGAGWLLKQGPAILGAEDDVAGFDEIAASHPLLADAHRRRPMLRLSRIGLVLQSLIPAVLEQKVTTLSAHNAWRRLVYKYGTPAPGPDSMPRGMRVPPTPRAWMLIPSWEWRQAEVDGKRAEAIIRACQRSAGIDRLARLPAEEAAEKLCTLPGIGPWTAAETLQRSHGSADLVSVGDLHLPRLICGILGAPGDRGYDDAKMLELLAPFAPHRQRAVRLLLSRR